MADDQPRNEIEVQVTEHPFPTDIPAEDLTQLAQLVGKMKGSVEKDGKNAHAGYRYATADAVYVGVRKAVCEAGFLPWQTEDSPVETMQIGQKRDGSPRTFVKVTYAIALTPGGRAPAPGHAEKVTVMAEFLSIQTFAALRTYALKYYLRGKLLLATGELDVDAEEGAPPEGGQTRQRQPARRSRSSSQQEPKGNGKWSFSSKTKKYSKSGEFATPAAEKAALYTQIRKKLTLNRDSTEAIAIYTANKDLIAEFPDQSRKQIVKMMSAHNKRIEAAREAAEAEQSEADE